MERFSSHLSEGYLEKIEYDKGSLPFKSSVLHATVIRTSPESQRQGALATARTRQPTADRRRLLAVRGNRHRRGAGASADRQAAAARRTATRTRGPDAGLSLRSEVNNSE